MKLENTSATLESMSVSSGPDSDWESVPGSDGESVPEADWESVPGSDWESVAEWELDCNIQSMTVIT